MRSIQFFCASLHRYSGLFLSLLLSISLLLSGCGGPIFEDVIGIEPLNDRAGVLPINPQQGVTSDLSHLSDL